MASIDQSELEMEDSRLKALFFRINLFTPLLWFVFCVVCLFYAVMAIEYFFSFGTEQQGGWLSILSLIVSSEYALGVGSVHLDQAVPYANGFYFMLVHTTFGGICLAIGPFQFISVIRQKFTKLHRTMGKIYLTSVVISMVAGLCYLFTTPMQQVFSGRPFSIGLIGLDLLVLFSAWLAYSSIRNRQIVKHQAWMAFNFSLILATPMLRIFWVSFGWTLPQFNQAQANLGIMTYLLPFCLLGGMIWYSMQNSRKKQFYYGGNS